MKALFAKRNDRIETAIALMLPVLLLLCAWCYWSGLNGIFLLDDFNNIKPTLMDEFSIEQFLQIASSNGSGMLRRPVSVISFSMTSLLHGATSWGFKYHNLLLHLINGILVFVFAKQLLKISLPQKTLSLTPIFALVAMAIWLFHPLHVSTVLYTVQRMTQWSALFSFLCFIFLFLGLQAETNTKKVICLFVIYPICLVLGLFSKENAALTPILTLLLYVFYSYRVKPISKRINLIFIWVFGIIPILLGLVVFLLKTDVLLDYSSRSFDLGDRLLSQIDYMFLYLRQLVFPRLSEMGLYLDDYVIPSGLNAMLLAKLLFLMTIFGIGLYHACKGKLWGLGVSFFFLGHLLESTILPLELGFEHRNYLPSFGIALVITSLISSLNIKTGKKSAIACLWVFLLASLLLLRVEFWSDNANWQQTTLAFHPLSERTRLNYIFDLENVGEHDLALQEIENSMRLLPDKISFPLMYLASTCHTTEEEDNLEIIGGIYTHLKNHNLSVRGFNSLAILTNRILNTGCQSIGIRQISNIINTASSEQEVKSTKSKNYGYLKVLQAKILIYRRMPLEASQYYMQAYEITDDRNQLFSAVKILLSETNTREQGLSLLEEIKNGVFFNANLYQYQVDQIETQIAEENYVFKF